MRFYKNPMTAGTHHPKINERYRIEALLGSGSMGQVYRAWDQQTGATVALKRLRAVDPHQAVAANPITLEADSELRREFHFLSTLRHPHIIRVHDYATDNQKRPFFIMEYLHDAEEIVSFAHDQPTDLILALLQEMLAALAYLHSRGILHRDLKPANVLVSGGAVKLLDFGLALNHIQLDPFEQALQGTAAYLAPELFQGAPPSMASDLYACGIIAYECLAGHHPFDTRNMNRLLLSILYEEPDINGLALDPSLQDFLRSLLVRDPQERPSSSDAAAELNKIRANFSGSALGFPLERDHV